MGHGLNNMGFQSDESSYHRLQDILPATPEEAKIPKSASGQSREVCTVTKDGFGQEMILRNNLHAEAAKGPSVSSKKINYPTSFRSSSGLFDASRGDSLKKLLDRKRTN